MIVGLDSLPIPANRGIDEQGPERQATGVPGDPPTEFISTKQTLKPATQRYPHNPQALHSTSHYLRADFYQSNTRTRQRLLTHKTASDLLQRAEDFGLARQPPQSATLPRPPRGRSGSSKAVFRNPAPFPQGIPHLWTT